MKKLFLSAIAAVLMASFAIMSVSAASNESIAAYNNLSIAESCIEDMIEHNISVARANESFTQARQLYNAQTALENRGGRANYKLVLQYSSETCLIRDAAVQASDELAIFLDEYMSASQHVNLSAMDDVYNAILSSYAEERFEETRELINGGYDALAATEAEQTRLDLIYRSTTNSIRSFLSEHWRGIATTILIALVALAIFWKALKAWIIRKKLSALKVRKDSLLELIKRTQAGYFKNKKMSEVEFKVKIKTFNEMIRDVERQFPVYTEKLAKLHGAKKVFK